MDEAQALQLARGAIRRGDKAAGQKLLAQVLQFNPRNETAWLWLSAIVNDQVRERECLERVIAINPLNEIAQRHLQRLNQLQQKQESRSRSSETYKQSILPTSEVQSKIAESSAPGERQERAMSQESLYPVDSLYDVWIRALTQPSVATFEDLVWNCNTTRAYTWVCVSTLIGYTISVVGSESFVRGGMDVSGALICGAPIRALLSVLGLTINAGITQLVASALGGTGTYSKLAYAFASYMAPLALVTSMLGCVPYCNLLSYPLVIYGIVLNVIAVKAVHEFGWGEAVVSSAFFFIAMSVAVVGALLLLGPVVGNVFSNILQEMVR